MIEAEVSGVSVPRFPRRDIADFARRAIRATERLGAAKFRASDVSIRLVRDAEMIRLNFAYRGKKKTTDVLTFEADDSYADPGASGRPLGDIVISVDQAKRQSAEQRHSLATELRYLILHGIIHAYGFDHETDHGEMNELELKARERLRLV